MTTPQTITSEIQKLEPSAIIELFEMDATAFGGDLLRFHAGTNGLRQNLVWQGNTYTAFPIKTSGFDMSGNGQLPRPKLQVANVTGAITLLVLTYDDLLGAKITRKRTLAKYLDAVNFPPRRNLLTFTDQFNGAGWGKDACTISANVILAPDGTQTADAIVEGTGLGYQRIQQNILVTGTHTFSIYAKKGERDWLTMDVGPTTYFNLATGEVGTVGAGVSASIQSAGSGWYRCSVTHTRTVLPFPCYVGASATGADDTNFTGTGAQSIYIWGAQLEAGSSVSDYQQVAATWSANPSADATAEFADDVFFIDRKVTETRDVVEFELAAAFDVAGVQLPRRQIIQNVCVWRYRGGECGYTGTSYFDANDAPVGSAGLDVCGKRLSSCKARFGANNPLPFGSFPAAGLTR